MRPVRLALPVLALTLIASPALAQPAERHRPTPEQAAQTLQNPMVQEVAARALTQLAGIVLDTRIGPAAALSGDRNARPDETLRDLARRDDPQFEEHLYQGTRRTLGTAGAVAGGAVMQGRELQRTADRLAAAIAPLVAAVGGSGD